MFNKLIYRLLYVISLCVLSPSLQVFAADKGSDKSVAAVKMLEKINLNSATNEQLAAIKGIGMKKAQAIIDYRQKNGDFISFEQLLNVKGIGPGTLKKITPFLAL